jgi:endoglucanase
VRGLLGRGLPGRAVASAVLVVLVAGAVVSGCGGSGGSGDTGAGPASNGALGEDVSFFVNPTSNAAQAVATLRATGHGAQAHELEDRIAGRPTATWLTPVPDAIYSQARELTQVAAQRGQMPVLVAYDLPGRDCGQYSSGGAADIDAYLQWVGSLAAGIGDQPALVVLEPDAVAHTLEGCGGSQSAAERFRMLEQAVAILKRQPEAKVYLDAGNASWIKDLDGLAGALRAAGVQRADGFVLNVSNFETTGRSVAYGEQLSKRLDGAHFVVDTSRNGAGRPAVTAGQDSHRAWCNPAGVRLGTPPTTRTGHRLADAFLWIKQPGDSDGTCGDGAPPAGQWWPRYAAELMGGTPS